MVGSSMGSWGSCRWESSYLTILSRLLSEFWARRIYAGLTKSSASLKLRSSMSLVYDYNQIKLS